MPGKQAPDLSDQQLHAARIHDHGALPMPLADRTVFQMDQATSAHQGLFRDFRKRGEGPNLDRDLRLRPRGDCQKADEARPEPLHNSTDFEHHPFRENPHFAGSFTGLLHNPGGGGLQPVEFVRLTTGQ